MSLAGPAALALAEDLGAKVALGASLGPYCTYKVGGPAAAIVHIDSVDDLEAVRRVIARDRVPAMVIGKGSNLLVSDAGYDGIVIHLGQAFSEITIDTDNCSVVAGGSALMPVVARKASAAGLRGLEWAVGVPGSIGGGVRMNAGGHGSDIAANLDEVSVFDLYDGGPEALVAAELDLSYRHSNLKATAIVLFARFNLIQGNSEDALGELSEIVRWRREHQPGGQNAGSVFTNPDGDSAGRLIDAAGLKGYRIGTAEVSDKHANFIQADPAGSADDVRALITHIQTVVFDAFGVTLTPENAMIGFDT